ncbi:MAG: transposase [Candidatus Omnitrophota bacterium]
MPRIARVVAADYPHHIIQRGNNRQLVFFDDADRQLYLKLLRKYSLECGCRVKAYCLMDNHVHLLLVPLEGVALAKTMQKLSLTFTQHINKKYKRTGRLWECRFHSCLVDKDVYLWAVCKYIERNPVRAGIVVYPQEYSWSSARISTALNCQNNWVEPVWKDYLGSREEYAKFLNQAELEKELEEMQKAVFSGKPIGTEQFLEMMHKQQAGINMAIRAVGRPRKHGRASVSPLRK